MANSCWSQIKVRASDSEFNEIASAFSNDIINWPICLSGPDCNYYLKEITCENKWGPTPMEGCMDELSNLYPSVLFHYTATYEGGEPPDEAWYLNGYCGYDEDYFTIYDIVSSFEAGFGLNNTGPEAQGEDSEVEIMPDGRVAAGGDNLFGECNVLSWTNIKEVSCGLWHTVGLKKDGTVVACGSNASGQCDVENLPRRAVAVSCGRYHTAILLESGKVEIRGNIKPSELVKSLPKEKELTPADFPMIFDLDLYEYTEGGESVNDIIEKMSVGDELTLSVSRGGWNNVDFRVENSFGVKIGDLNNITYKLYEISKHLRASVETITPLSEREEDSIHAAMTIRIDCDKTFQQLDIKQTQVSRWPAVKNIQSVVDAVIGLTADGQVYIDGYCPRAEHYIRHFLEYLEN